jgi:hypothetical protein
MKTKLVNFQCVYEVPDEYSHVAMNQNGSLVGFSHPPIRDPALGEWIDSTDGSMGTLIPYEKWDTSVRPMGELSDLREKVPNMTKYKKKTGKKNR